jgi:formamidopyrimidine-DNA glycosylase
MPELPEVETVRTTLDAVLRGRTLSGVDVRWARSIAHPGVEEFARRIAGQSIAAVDRRAKFVVIRLHSSEVVTVHLRMTGELRFHLLPTTEEADPPYLRVQFQFRDHSILNFTDIRKFGRIALLTQQEFADVSNALGLEPLSDDFTPGELQRILKLRQRQVKPLLLDQRVIAGIGNIYADEALFRAGIHPLSSSASIPDDQINRLHAAIVGVLNESIEHRGTTVRNYRSGLGDPGEHQSRLLVYGRGAGTACFTCTSPLSRIVVAQRGTMFCPTCQRLFTSD